MVVGDSCDQVIHISTAAGGFKVVGDKIVHLIYICRKERTRLYETSIQFHKMYYYKYLAKGY